jgi:hypothetical protein
MGKVIFEQFGRLDTRAHFPPPSKQNEMEKGNAGELGARPRTFRYDVMAIAANSF